MKALTRKECLFQTKLLTLFLGNSSLDVLYQYTVGGFTCSCKGGKIGPDCVNLMCKILVASPNLGFKAVKPGFDICFKAVKPRVDILVQCLELDCYFPERDWRDLLLVRHDRRVVLHGFATR